MRDHKTPRSTDSRRQARRRRDGRRWSERRASDRRRGERRADSSNLHPLDFGVLTLERRQGERRAHVRRAGERRSADRRHLERRSGRIRVRRETATDVLSDEEKAFLRALTTEPRRNPPN